MASHCITSYSLPFPGLASTTSPASPTLLPLEESSPTSTCIFAPSPGWSYQPLGLQPPASAHLPPAHTHPLSSHLQSAHLSESLAFPRKPPYPSLPMCPMFLPSSPDLGAGLTHALDEHIHTCPFCQLSASVPTPHNQSIPSGHPLPIFPAPLPGQRPLPEQPLPHQTWLPALGCWGWGASISLQEIQETRAFRREELA